jgi:hypothetical protein
MQNSKTHFEQIPVELVKKIIASARDGGNDSVSFEGPATKTEPHATAIQSLHTDIQNCRSPIASKSDEFIDYPEWQSLYKEALLEIDTDKLKQKIVAAEAAIAKRATTLSRIGLRNAEWQAIEDALAFLRVLGRH